MGTSPSDKHKYPVWAQGRKKKEKKGEGDAIGLCCYPDPPGE